MIKTLCCQKVCDAFSDAAFRYDQLTNVHQNIGRELIDRIKLMKPSGAILDIGMGSGWFTDGLTIAFPKSLVVGLDFASGMVACARQKKGRFKIIQADAVHLPFKKGSFRLITSNLAYQWVKDLPQAFSSCRFCLNKKGKLFFTMFGYETLRELFEALKACAGKKGIVVKRLAKKNNVFQTLRNAGFGTIQIKEQCKRVYFRDMLGLLQWIKDIGANTLPRNFYFGKDLLQDANQYYGAHFRDTHGVYTTLEVIWVEAA